MRVYTCDACKSGNHELCEIGHSVPKGYFGGSRCRCGCRGRSKGQIEKDAKKRLKETEKYLRDLKRVTEESRKSQLKFD